MTARRLTHPWCDEELDACQVAVQDTTDTSEWIGSILLCALATLIVLLFGVPLASAPSTVIALTEHRSIGLTWQIRRLTTWQFKTTVTN